MVLRKSGPQRQNNPLKAQYTPSNVRKRSQALCNRKYLKKRRRQFLKTWKPIYTEGLAAVKAIKAGRFDSVEPEDKIQAKIIELVEMMTNEAQLLAYDTPEKRATALGATVQEVSTWRKTFFYKQHLIYALQNRSLEGVAESMPTMIARAKVMDDKAGVQAFDKLMKIGELGKNVPAQVTKNVMNVKITFEQQVKDYADQRKKLNAKVIDEVTDAAK